MSDDICHVYSQIAREFDYTRYKPWPSVVSFVNSLETNNKLLDVGCGNGRHLQINPNIVNTGCDLCPEFVQICRDKGLDVVESDCRKLPFADNSFDAVICIAVIHHLDTEEDRQRAVAEIVRITKPGGKIMIQVWADSVLGTKTGSKFTKLQGQGDYSVSWTTKSSEVLSRFYHVFNREEFEKMLSEVGSIEIVHIWEEANNWIGTINKN